MTATARYATRPTPGAQHQAGAVAAIARELGTPLMPWQYQVARVATELAPDGIGWRYPIVVVSVPRQSGKTTLMRSVMAQRAIQRPKLQAFYTAQTGKDASERWRDLVKAVTEHQTMGAMVDPRYAAGSQALTWPNGSAIRPFAPTPKSLHGYTPPLVMVDEAFAHDAAAGAALEGAIRPAQITIADRQWWIVSTMGTASSTWFHGWVDVGRQAVTDPAAQVAYFEWSLDEQLDPYDPANWSTFHPALSLTITQDALTADAATLPRGEWERAYCNRRTSAQHPILDLAAWGEHARPAAAIPIPTPGRPVGIGYDLAHDRGSAAVWTAWVTPDGLAVLKAWQTGPGIDWVPDAVDDASAAIPGAVVGACPDGAVRQATDELLRRDRTIHTIKATDYATACGAFLHRAAAGLVIHDGSPTMAAAISVAATRPMGDGATGFSQRDSAGPIAALRAATAALRLAEVKPAEVKPVIYA